MARLSIFLVGVAFIAGTLGCDPVPDYLRIWNWHNLYATRDNLSGHYVLMNDLDSASPGYMELASPTANQGRGWQPIGTSDDRFTGSFDGQGYEIRDLFINRPDESMVGLFGAVDEGAVIQNAGVVNATITGEWAVGGLVGGNWGHVTNSYSSGNVSGDDYIGGLVGGNAGGVSYSYSAATVIGRWDVGGLIGGNDSQGTVSSSYSDSSATGEWAVGGLVGGNLGGTVSSCYSISSAAGDDYVGGLVGDNQGIVRNAYATGSVNGEWHVGGLVGYNDLSAIVSSSYAMGYVSGQLFVGGLVGYNQGTVSNSFWNMETSAIEESDGGTGKTTVEMQDIGTFTDTTTEGLDDPWVIIAVAPGVTNPTYTWNIVDGQAYPFLS
jgi:hypothetical protein